VSLEHEQLKALAKECGAEVTSYINYHFDQEVVLFSDVDDLAKFVKKLAAPAAPAPLPAGVVLGPGGGWIVNPEAAPVAPMPTDRDEATAFIDTLLEHALGAEKTEQVRELLSAAPAPHPDTQDAERYRWLRERYSELTCMECAVGLGLDLRRVYVNTPEKFDAVLDAAIAASNKEKS
jgi:hypothetical protein